MTNQDNQNKNKNPYYTQNELVQQSPSPLHTQQMYPALEGNNYSRPVYNNNNNFPIANGIQTHNQYISNQTNPNNNYIQHPPQHQQNFQQPPPPIIIINQNNPLAHCNFCGIQTQTYITKVNGGFVWLMCFVFFLCVCWLCCIPFFVDQWKDKQFRCRKCGQVKNIVHGSC